MEFENFEKFVGMGGKVTMEEPDGTSRKFEMATDRIIINIKLSEHVGIMVDTFSEKFETVSKFVDEQVEKMFQRKLEVDGIYKESVKIKDTNVPDCQ